MRVLLPILVLCLTPARPAGASDMVSYSLSGRMTMQVNVHLYPHAEFHLGDLVADWDEVERYELDLIYLHPLDRRVEALGGLYLFYEQRDYRSGTAVVDYDILGFGWEGGVILYPLPNGSMRGLNLGIMPYGRLGWGNQDAYFDGIPYDPDFADGIIDDERLELGVGLDARLTIGRHVQFTAGVGAQKWLSDETPARRVDADGETIDILQPLNFDGTDTWLRIGLGVQF
ncbi:MAG: hypothetical protein ACOCXJ_08900 [Planctomycetota bacterium]